MAMLAMRKHLKKLSIFLWIVIAAFIGTIFVVWGAGRRGIERGGGQSVELASVNGDRILRDEYIYEMRRYADYYRNIYKDRMTPEALKSLDLENRVLQDLIRKRLLLQEADRLGIVVTDEEVTSVIEKTPAFQDQDGKFRPELYMRLLSMNRIAPESYERGIRQNQKVARLQDFIRATVRVTDDEVKAKYIEDKEKVNCKFVEFKGSDFAKDLKPSDAELLKLYESQKEMYKSEREVKVEYVVFSSEDHRPKVQISDEQLQDYYDDNQSRYVQEEQVRARHILVKVPKDASKKVEQEAKKKIEGLLARVKAGEDFAKLAKENSDCPSASKGGDLGFFGRGQMAKPFEEVAFSLPVGEVSDIVKTEFGYHIIKVEERKEPATKEFSEVADEIRTKLTNEKASELAKAAAESAHEKIGDSSDLEGFAEGNGLKLHTTDFFKRTDEIEGLGRSFRFADAAMGLAKDAVSPVVKDKDSYFLIKLLDEKTPIVLPFDEAKTRVVRDFEKQEGDKLAKQKADEFAREVKDLESFDRAAKSRKLTAMETGMFSRDGYVRGIGRSDEFAQKAFATEVGGVGGPISVQNRYVFYAVLEHTKFVQEDFDEEKGQLAQKMRADKEDEAFTAWIEDLRKKAKIQIEADFAKKQPAPARPPIDLGID